MSQHLLIDPNQLYKLFNNPDECIVEPYQSFTCFYDFNSIDVHIFYDIFNSLTLSQLNNLNRYLFKYWSLTTQNPKLLSFTSTRSHLLKQSFTHRAVTSYKDESKNV